MTLQQLQNQIQRILSKEKLENYILLGIDQEYRKLSQDQIAQLEKNLNAYMTAYITTNSPLATITQENFAEKELSSIMPDLMIKLDQAEDVLSTEDIEYDIIFTSPSVIENEIVASNFRIPTNPTMITDNFRAIYKLPWELHDSAKEQEIELEFIIHLKELVNHILSNTDQVTLFYDQVMLRSLITLSSNEQLTKMLQGFIDNENLTFNKDPFREVLKHKEEDKKIPIYITIGARRRN